MQLAAWEVGESDRPVRLPVDNSFLEHHLESWIEQDPTLLLPRLQWVARQLILPDSSRLDLLGIDADGTWVIVELKRAGVNTGTLAQVMHYFLELGQLTNSELVRRVKGYLHDDHPLLDDLQRLADEDGDSTDRDYRLVVAGAGDGQAAESAAAVLTHVGFTVPVSVVSFHVVAGDDGRRVLLREVDEETVVEGSRPGGSTLDHLLRRCDECGVRTEIDAIRALMAEAGFGEYVRRSGLNFNTGRRAQVFWVRPEPQRIHLGCLTDNLPALVGVDESLADRELGTNWLTLPPDEAVETMRRWSQQVASWWHEPPAAVVMPSSSLINPE